MSNVNNNNLFLNSALSQAKLEETRFVAKHAKGSETKVKECFDNFISIKSDVLSDDNKIDAKCTNIEENIKKAESNESLKEKTQAKAEKLTEDANWGSYSISSNVKASNNSIEFGIKDAAGKSGKVNVQYAADGSRVLTTTINGVTTEKTIDANGNTVKNVTTNKSTGETRISKYDESGKINTQKVTDTKTGMTKAIYYYDDAGQLARRSNYNNEGKLSSVSDFEYDVYGNLSGSYTTIKSGSDKYGKVSAFSCTYSKEQRTTTTYNTDGTSTVKRQSKDSKTGEYKPIVLYSFNAKGERINKKIYPETETKTSKNNAEADETQAEENLKATIENMSVDNELSDLNSIETAGENTTSQATDANSTIKEESEGQSTSNASKPESGSASETTESTSSDELVYETESPVTNNNDTKENPFQTIGSIIPDTIQTADPAYADTTAQDLTEKNPFIGGNVNTSTTQGEMDKARYDAKHASDSDATFKETFNNFSAIKDDIKEDDTKNDILVKNLITNIKKAQYDESTKPLMESKAERLNTSKTWGNYTITSEVTATNGGINFDVTDKNGKSGSISIMYNTAEGSKMVTSIIDGVSTETVYDQNNKKRQAIVVTEANKETVVYKYDDTGRINTRKIFDTETGFVKALYSYDDNGQLSRRHLYNEKGELATVSDYEYDENTQAQSGSFSTVHSGSAKSGRISGFSDTYKGEIKTITTYNLDGTSTVSKSAKNEATGEYDEPLSYYKFDANGDLISKTTYTKTIEKDGTVRFDHEVTKGNSKEAQADATNVKPEKVVISNDTDYQDIGDPVRADYEQEPTIPQDDIPEEEPSIPENDNDNDNEEIPNTAEDKGADLEDYPEDDIPEEEPSVPEDEPSIPDEEQSIPDEPSIPDEEQSIPDEPENPFTDNCDELPNTAENREGELEDTEPGAKIDKEDLV